MSNPARAYDRWYATGLGSVAHRIELALLASAARPRAGERAVDVGCGTGMISAWLAGQMLIVTGLDRDPAGLAAAQARVPLATFVDGDATALPFPDCAFDLAMAVTLFCFLDTGQRRAAAEEMLRVVRPGGRIVIGELARWSLWAAQRRVRGWLGSERWRHAHFSTPRELRMLLADAGAQRVETHSGLYLPPWDVAALTSRADGFERAGRHFGTLGASFVVARGERDALLDLALVTRDCLRQLTTPAAPGGLTD